MKYLILLSLLCCVCIAQSQATLTVNHARIRIGDQLKATIELQSSMGGSWTNKKDIWPDSTKGFEVVSGPDTTAANTGGLVATWSLSFFDTGYVYIPKLPVILSHQGKVDTFYTEDIPIQVQPVEPDSSGLAGIKEIYVHPFSLAFYKKYIPHILGLALLVTGLIYWWKKRKRKMVEPEIIAVPITPHDWAYEELQKLAALQLWQKGEIKEHYSLLTGILRGYLEKRFDIQALEQTSDEIITQLQSLQLSPRTLQDTESLLSIADLIKFAKADPGIDLHAEAIERVRMFVKETTIASLAPASPTTPDEHVAMD